MGDEINDSDNRVLELIERLDARAAELESGFQLLIRLAQGHDSQLDTHRGWINQLGEAQAESTQKIAALADAQIRTEEALARLASVQAHTDQRLDALIDIVRGMRGGGQGRQRPKRYGRAVRGAPAAWFNPARQRLSPARVLTTPPVGWLRRHPREHNPSRF